MRKESEFFVGYLPMPPGLTKIMVRVIAALGIVVIALAVFLVAGQRPFPASTFEFQRYREFQGVVRTHPYPALAVSGNGLPWLLVGPGKHGVSEVFRALDGREVRLKGARIFRGEDRMLELLPGSLEEIGPAADAGAVADLGPATLTGEIVDSKCYFGVMNPGNGKVHRDCAVRCISGGIPPAFLARDVSGRAMTLLLAGSDSRALSKEVLDYVAEPVVIRGRLARSRGRLILLAEPRDFHRYQE